MSQRVTVAIPLYNKADFIYEALTSVAAQSYRDLTILVIDDRSTDKSVAEVHRFKQEHPRVELELRINDQNLGVQGNGNRCLELPTTEYIARFDADDMMPEDRIRKQVEFLDGNPAVVQVGGYLKLIGKEEKLSKLPLSNEEIQAQMPIFNGISQGTSMFRRMPIFESDIRYDESGPAVGEDWLFFYKLGRHFEMANLPDVMDIYRIHEDNISVARGAGYYKDIDQVLRYILADLGVAPSDEDLMVHYFLRGQFRIEINASSISRFSAWTKRLRHAYQNNGLSLNRLDDFITRTYEQLYFQVIPSDKEAIALLQESVPMTAIHRKYLQRKKLKRWLGMG